MQTGTRRILGIGGILVLGILCGVRSNLPAADQPKVACQVEWEKTVKAAEQEGQVTLYSNEGIEASIKNFQNKFPKIKVVLVSGRAGQLVTRLMGERRGGKYLADLTKLGTGSASTLYRARPFPLQPFDSSFILPEVTDKSKWWQGKHQYADPEGKYIFSHALAFILTWFRITPT